MMTVAINRSQGSMAKKDVIFHRSSTYLWNVNLEKADLAHIFKVHNICF